MGTSKQRLEYIDFAKGFAILSIVIMHYCQPYVSGLLSKAIMFGGSGVHLFFILSGFGLGLSSHSAGIFDFYKRRVSKILAPYFLVIIIIYILNLIYPFYHSDGLYALMGHLLLFKMFDESIMTSFGYQFWFLSTIIQFYIVYPLIVGFKNRVSPTWFLIISCLISILYWCMISVFGVADQRVFNSSFVQFLWEFNLGMVLVDLYRTKHFEIWNCNLYFFWIAAIAGISLMAYMAINGGVLGRTFNDFPASIGFFSFSVIVYSLCLGKLMFIRRFIIYIGYLSYELYLLHMIVFLLITTLLTKIIGLDLNVFIALIFVLPTAILLSRGFVSFYGRYFDPGIRRGVG